MELGGGYSKKGEFPSRQEKEHVQPKHLKTLCTCLGYKLQNVIQVYHISKDRACFFQNDGLPKFVTSIAFSAHGDVISGDSSGRILVWRKDTNGAYVIDRRCSEHLKTAHTVNINSILMHQFCN